MGDLERVAFAEPAPLTLRSAPLREIEARLFRWGDIGETDNGAETIERGGVEGTDPSQVFLRVDHDDPAVGRARAIEEREDGPYGIFRVARTAGGDNALALTTPSEDGEPALYQHVSVGFVQAPPDAHRTINGRRVAVRKRIDLREVSITWRPAYAGASIIDVRSASGGSQPMGATAQTTGEPAASAPVQMVDPTTTKLDQLLERIDQMEERARRAIDIPPAPAAGDGIPKIDKGEWAQAAMRLMTGERLTELETRALADVISTDNAGVVPVQVRSELIGIIDPSRPFMQSTRQVPAGDSGLELQFPRIVQRPIAGVQTAEKAELPSQKTIIDTVSFTAVTKGGAGDLSMQLLKRSSPSFLNLWLELLAEAYAIDAEDEALDALLAAMDLDTPGADQHGGTFDPEAPAYATAFTNAAAVSKSPLMRPDRAWLSTAALAAFMDARSPAGGGGTPMYPQLAGISGLGAAAGAGAGDGAGMALRPVWVPALDDEAVDIVIGPSRGFAWAEDGTYTLQADVPSKFGRDVGIAGMVWFMPIYPEAFTAYTLPA